LFDCRNRQSLACYHTMTLDIIGLHAMVLLYRNNYYSQTAPPPTATAACAAYCPVMLLIIRSRPIAQLKTKQSRAAANDEWGAARRRRRALARTRVPIQAASVKATVHSLTEITVISVGLLRLLYSKARSQ